MKRITLRQATEQDWPAIQQLHREHQAAQGTNYELPNLFGPAIAIALVGVEDPEGVGPSGIVSTWRRLRSCALWDAIPKPRRSAAGRSRDLVTY